MCVIGVIYVGGDPGQVSNLGHPVRAFGQWKSKIQIFDLSKKKENQFKQLAQLGLQLGHFSAWS